MKIEKIGAIAQDAGVKAILHGPSGSGKTYSIASIPNHHGVIVLSAEAGLLSIRETASDIDGIEIHGLDELREAYAYISGDDGKKYHTVVLDSLTEIAQQVLSSEMAKTKDGRKAYGEMNDVMTKLVKSFRDLSGKNVILICQQSKVQDDEGRIFYGPSMPGKTLAQWIPYATDLVACIRIRKDAEGTVKRAFQFAELDEQYQAKNRGGKLDDFEPPDWAHIFGKINGVTINPKNKKETK